MLQMTDTDFIRLKNFMYTAFGINLENKRVLMEGRLSAMVSKRGYASFAAYIDDVLKDKSGREVSTLVTRLTTNFTYFMREEEHYRFLREKVFPDWKKIPIPRRIWSAACSSGEEPYSLAMTLHDFFGAAAAAGISVVASDISQNVLEKARMGVYPMDRVSKLPQEWASRFIKKVGADEFEIVPSIKSMVQYKYFNLNDKIGWIPNSYDVIFCRNVMIYFDRTTREKLIKQLHGALKAGGYLIIGMSETLVNLNTDFTYVKPSVYQKSVTR